jgi:AcrR family transcriptional regulator
MGSNERREREKQELRRKILDTARQMFVTEGYDAVSMRRIAQKIEYSPTAIYLHFKDKEALFAELCSTDFRRLAQTFQTIAEIRDPVERLRGIGQTYLGFALEYPNHYRLMFMTPHPANHIPDDISKGNPEEDAYALLKLTVEEALKAGRFRSDIKSADLVAQTLWAGVHGVASLQIAKHQDHWVTWRPITERSDLMLDGLLRGLVRDNAKEKK